jgi:HEAT repeat protein
MIIATLIALVLAQVPANSIPVDGPDLKSRHAAAIKQGSAQQGPFWAAYTFPVRAGVIYDAEVIGWRGSAALINGSVAGAVAGSRNLGVFVLHEGSSGRVIRAEIYRLDRPRDYAEYRVYWLGNGTGNESLPLLRSLVDNSSSPEAAARLVDAMGGHDDALLPDTLRNVSRSAKLESARATAVSWLGQLPGQVDFLAGLARDEGQNLSVRREAAESLGDSSDPDAMPALQSLYRAVTHREVKRELIEAVGDSAFEGTAVSFLIEIAERETVRELRNQAIEELGDLPDERAIGALVRLYDSVREEETKEEILDALGEAEVELAWQKLAEVAQRDPSLKLRKQAIELLGESNNPNTAVFLEKLIR